MHVTHDALTVARAGDGENSGPPVPSKIEGDPGAPEYGQPDSTDVRPVPRPNNSIGLHGGDKRSAEVEQSLQISPRMSGLAGY